MKKNKSTEYGAELRDRFARWKDLNENGGSDPSCPDGANMNLVRNHIIWIRRKCEEELDPGEYPKEYFFELPPKVDSNYMANPEEIRENAEKSLEIFKANPDFRYIEKNYTKLSKRDKDNLCVVNILNYTYGLETAIKDDDLVSMRRKRNPEGYLESFKECRKRMEKILGSGEELPLGQLTLFDLFSMT